MATHTPPLSSAPHSAQLDSQQPSQPGGTYRCTAQSESACSSREEACTSEQATAQRGATSNRHSSSRRWCRSSAAMCSTSCCCDQSRPCCCIDGARISRHCCRCGSGLRPEPGRCRGWQWQQQLQQQWQWQQAEQQRQHCRHTRPRLHHCGWYITRDAVAVQACNR